MDDFSQHPPTVGEIRSNKSQNAKDWTPRDMLVHLLRAIDCGEIALDSAVVCYRAKDEKGDEFTGWQAATPNVLVTLGLLSRVSYSINDAGVV